MNKDILIVSPIPSHPQFQGNSARIYRLNQMFKLLGYRVHFVYFGMEGLNETQRLEMESDWDTFHFVKPEGPAAEPSFVDYFDIDDWYDEKVSELVEDLCGRYKFDICLVNYVWFSKGLDVVPETTYKIIDTHDVFGDRHIVAAEAGLEPVWFYTTKALEALGLERADLILAIQSEEAKYFEGLVETPISTVGYLVPPVVLVEEPHETSAKINIGYIGSGNPFNVTSILALHDFVSQYPCLLEKFEFSIAGTICSALKSKVPNFNLVGLVDELDDFYRVIDVVVNPMIGGTGLKIKSLEALSYGKPLIATKDAMVGISTTSDFQKFESVELLVSALRTFDNTAKEQLAIDSVNVFQAYNAQQIATFKKLFGNVE